MTGSPGDAVARASRLAASDRFPEAGTALDRALEKWPDDPELLALTARVRLELGAGAVAAYERALVASPGERALELGLADALFREGQVDRAIARLQVTVDRNPGWTEGHAALASMRWRRGDGDLAISSYLKALQRSPQNTALWMALIQMLSSGSRHDLVLKLIASARAQIGAHRTLDLIEAFALSETDTASAGEAFQRLAPIDDPTYAPVVMRYLLRVGLPEQAAEIGERFVDCDAASSIWPLLGTAWRLVKPDRWRWLERPDETVAAIDLGLTSAELENLGTVLRRLHVGSHHPHDQSPRGGTQTQGNLLNRAEPELRKLRVRIQDAVGDYIRGLPPIEPDHPFLGVRRGKFRFAGSWSIRLLDEGFHVAHVHPAGWISSACYIALPEPELGAKAGWLKLGEPPAELSTGLDPLRWIEPKPGVLALFPSIMWHGTEPFPAGERLTVAFDVVSAQ